MIRFRVPTNFYESILPILIFSTIIGVFPMLPVRIRQNYVLQTSKKLHLITTLLLAIYSGCFVMTIIKRSNNVVGQKFYKEQNKVSNFGLTFEFIISVIILYTIYFASFVQTKRVKTVLENLNTVDNMFKKINRRIPYKNTAWYQILIILSGIITMAFIGSMQMQNVKIENFPPLSAYMWFLFLYPMVALYGINSQFSITVILIYQRFKVVNKELEKIKGHLNEQPLKMKSESMISRNVTVLSKIHEILCESVRRTNLNYNVQMLPSLIHQYFTSVYAIFYFYWMHSSKPFSASCWLAWGFFKVYEILQVAISCHLASEEAKTVGRKIHKILITSRNDEIDEKLIMFSQQVNHNNFNFTLCGLFNIDGSLLFNMIGSSTTFIVIMIQFQETITPPACVSNKTVLLF